MSLKFEPETDVELQTRYGAAVEETIDAREIRAGKRAPPSGERKHVFDHFSGLRLIASRETDGMSTFTHYSASMHPENDFDSFHEFLGFIMDHIKNLRGAPLQGRVNIVTQRGIVHILYDEIQSQIDLNPPGNPLWN